MSELGDVDISGLMLRAECSRCGASVVALKPSANRRTVVYRTKCCAADARFIALPYIELDLGLDLERTP